MRCPPAGGKPADPPKGARRVIALAGDVTFRAGAGAISLLDLGESPISLGLRGLPARGVPFSAESLEIRNGLLIYRVVVAKGPGSSFRFDRAAQTATLRPPADFSGAATVANCPEPNWTGSLEVGFPGLTVSLTQRRFRTAAELFPTRPCSKSR